MDCPKCEFSGNSTEVISHHTRVHIKGIDERFTCTECYNSEDKSRGGTTFTFDNVHEYMHHRIEKHNEKREDLPKEIRKKTRDNKNICKECGKEFRGYACEEHGVTRDFCSTKCAGISRRKREERECPACGDTFEVIPSYPAEFCSFECANSGKYNYNYIDGHSSRRDYGESWPKRRKQAKERDYNMCRVCRISQEECKKKYNTGLQVHHQTPIRFFDDKRKGNRLQNLLTVCPRCHGNLEKELST